MGHLLHIPFTFLLHYDESMLGRCASLSQHILECGMCIFQCCSCQTEADLNYYEMFSTDLNFPKRVYGKLKYLSKDDRKNFNKGLHEIRTTLAAQVNSVVSSFSTLTPPPPNTFFLIPPVSRAKVKREFCFVPLVRVK